MKFKDGDSHGTQDSPNLQIVSSRGGPDHQDSMRGEDEGAGGSAQGDQDGGGGGAQIGADQDSAQKHWKKEMVSNINQQNDK
jgi:hypothetical protein